MKTWKISKFKPAGSILSIFISLIVAVASVTFFERSLGTALAVTIAVLIFVLLFAILGNYFMMEKVELRIENEELIIRNRYFRIFHCFPLHDIQRVYTTFSYVPMEERKVFVVVTENGVKHEAFRFSFGLLGNYDAVCDDINRELKLYRDNVSLSRG